MEYQDLSNGLMNIMADKVLVTGATGFIGSHLMELLVDNGFNVVGFDRYNSDNNWGWLENYKSKKKFNIILGDIRDYDSVVKSMKGCKTVFHLAALIGIPYSYISPLAYIRTNIEGTYNILEAAKNNRLDQIIITSTSETYGTAQYTPIDENHPLVGQSPYSASKIAADQLAISYYKSFDLPVKIARPFNTYGPRQSSRAIIPTIISQILKGTSKLKVGSLSPTRDLTFVKDTVSGFLNIYNSDNLFGEVTNIGMNNEISIKDLINKIANLMEETVNIIQEDDRVRPAKSEVNQLLCENIKLITQTKWKPNYNLESGLIETIDWIRNNKSYFLSDDYMV